MNRESVLFMMNNQSHTSDMMKQSQNQMQPDTAKRSTRPPRDPPTPPSNSGFGLLISPAEIFKKLRNYKPDNSSQTTSLVSIISPKCDPGLIRRLVKQEQTTAHNIKNNLNRKSVVEALSNIWSKIEGLKAIPDTGIAIYAGQYI